MARWYSKRHKAKITADFKRYGYIPPYGEIMRYAMAPHNHVSDLEKCEFDGTCDFCSQPKRGTFVSMDYGPDYTEANYYICGKCVIKRHRNEHLGRKGNYFGYSKFEQWKRRQSLSDGQFICSWCDEIANKACTCAGAEYWLNKDPEAYERDKAA